MGNYGDWVVAKSLGKGGQGEVFLVREVPRKDFGDLGRGLHSGDSDKKVAAIWNAISVFSEARRGALKLLHSPEDSKNARTAKERFRKEIKILGSVEHPSIIKLLGESNDHHKWFVMEYHQEGTLAENRRKYQGDLLGALSALRPVVEAVAKLHGMNEIHRDIKPENIFIADDERLVLGDFGLVIETDAEGTRLTETHEPAGSRRWMPTWAQSGRDDEPSPRFDVFTLGKVLWAMVSAEQYCNLHQFQYGKANLETQFPDKPEMEKANDFLGKCIAEYPESILKDAKEMLVEMNALETALRVGPDAVHAVRLLFPGKWRNDWQRTDGKKGTEGFHVDEKGEYVIKGKATFALRVLATPSPDRVVLERRRLGTGQIKVEKLKIVGDSSRMHEDSYGNSVRYTRVGNINR